VTRLAVDRLGQAIAALAVLSVVTFVVSRLTGNPLDLMLSPEATRAQYAQVAHELGIDRPLLVQYGLFVLKALHGDLGDSYRSGVPVTQLVTERLWASAQLSAAALAETVLVGVPLGVLSARRAGHAIDSIVKSVALLGQSLPSFWVGIVLIEVFAVRLGWLPAGGAQKASSIVLPSATLALYGIASIARLLRSSMLDVLGAEFVKLARAKGLSETRVIWKHALRNALLPVVSYAGLFFVNLLTLSVVVEVVFAWPGLGQLTYTAILSRDFPVIQGVVLLAGTVAILVNLATDVMYVYLDPRIRYSAI
jgi:peptide/nickel transport system permease protein